MEELKKLLGDELFAKVAEKLGSQVLFMHEKDQQVLVDDGSLIPKYRLDEVIKQRDQKQELIDQNEKDLKALKSAAAGNAELTKQIDDLQKANTAAKETAAKNELAIRKSFALKEHLMNAGVADPEARDLLSLRFDPAKIELDAQGKIVGFDDLLKPVKENKTLAGMFVDGNGGDGMHHSKAGTSGSQFYTPEQVKAMSQEEVNANLEKVNKSMATWK